MYLQPPNTDGGFTKSHVNQALRLTTREVFKWVLPQMSHLGEWGRYTLKMRRGLTIKNTIHIKKYDNDY